MQVDFENFQERGKILALKDGADKAASKEARNRFLISLFLANYTLTEDDFKFIVNHCSDTTLNYLSLKILPKMGEVFRKNFELKDFDEQDLVNQIAHYARRYLFGIDDHDYSVRVEIRDYLESINKEKKKLDIIKKPQELTEILDSICNRISNPTNTDKKLISLYIGYINFENNFSNKIVLETILNALDKNLLAKFLEKYKVQTLNDIRIIVQTILGVGIKSRYQKLKLSQCLKTFIMRGVDNVIKLKGFKYALDEAALYRDFFELMQYKIITTQKRYQKYSQAQSLFNSVLKREYSENTRHKLQLILKSSLPFEVKFREFYGYNVDYAYKHIIAIFNNSNVEDLDWLKISFTLREFKPRNIKQIYAALIAVEKAMKGIKIHKLKGAFFKNKKSRLLEDGSEQGINLEINREEVYKPLKLALEETLLQTFVTSKYNEFANLFEGKKIFIEPELSNIQLPIWSKDAQVTKNLFTEGSIFNLEGLKNIRIFAAWKKKDNTGGELDLDLHCRTIGTVRKHCFYASQSFRAYKHSGDFTSCRRFYEDNPVITAEFIDVDLKELDDACGTAHFYISSYNRAELKDYDIYCGVSPCVGTGGGLVNLNDAYIFTKIESNDLYVDLFEMTKNQVKFLGKPLEREPNTAELQAISEYYNYETSQVSFYNLLEKMFFVRGIEIVKTAEEADEIIGLSKDSTFDVAKNIDIFKDILVK